MDSGGEHSRTTKDAKFGEIGKYFSLRSWRDEEKIVEKITLAKNAKDAKC